MPAASKHVAVLVYDGVRTLDVTGPLEVFDVARSLRCDYTVALYAVTDGVTVRCSSGMTVGAAPISELRSTVDTLVVPGGECLVAPGPDPRLVAAIRRHAPAARRTASICAGSFALAAAGLLDGVRTTTHWRLLDVFARRHPEAVLESESVYVRDGEIWSSAGVAAGIDLTLALVADDHGAAIAHEIGKDMVVFSRRLEGHPQLSVAARTPRPSHPRLDHLLQTINAEPAAKYTLDKVAADIGVSPRHLARLFRSQVGCTLREYVVAVRMEGAVGLVLAGESFHAAARRCGLRDGSQLRELLASPPPPFGR
ncbi:GlxA family transcriptional regulator [Mycobacterium sp. 3519A]|uniref:GlxA family transcriptional regulator n=1 Tax=Mycobacterium sp. 3519A TaxID=2057184 RepID=UPI000C7D30D6|nr:AraC family transcriptional regulator [Mycobacterium sp. 3519A]